MSSESVHLRLAGITRLSLNGRGPRDAYVFDPHRLALSSWALGLESRPPALLLTFDRHMDLVAPTGPVPDVSVGVLALDAFVRQSLDVRNVDHILAAMDAGLLTDAWVFARSHPRGAVQGPEWTDTRGRTHRLTRMPRLAPLLEDYDAPAPGSLAADFKAALAQHEDVVLDLDLDCFTTPNDADPDVLLSWTREMIRDFLCPPGSEVFWDAVLAKTRVLTLAREPHHCGGLIAAGRLFEELAHVLFRELLQVDLP